MARRFRYRGAFTAGLALCAGTLAALLAASCSTQEDELEAARKRITGELNGMGIYERGNVPENVEEPKGYYDIIGGAYRYIRNEGRPDRTVTRQIEAGDSVSLRFVARIYTGKYDSSTVFYTNVALHIPTGNNPSVDRNNYWDTNPLRIKVGEDPKILNSLQTALIGCWPDNGNPADDAPADGVTTVIVSDYVIVYLTPNIAFGNKRVYGVPANSTLVFEVSDLQLIN